VSMRSLTATAALLFIIASSAGASADTIGQAASTKNVVTGIIGALEKALATGDKVSGNETVKTGIKSAAVLQFLDNSKLNIGASSTVLLDRFVYNPDAGARNGIIRLSTGALRFASGGHEAKDFAVQTPVASLVARGTDFAVICDRLRCVALMATGRLRVCPRYNLLAPRPTLANCPNSYGLDQRVNFTLVGPQGENSGPQRIDPSVVAAVIAAIARGDKNPSITRLAALASASIGGPPPSQKGTNFSNGQAQPPSPSPPSPPPPPPPPPGPPPPPLPPPPPPPPH